MLEGPSGLGAQGVSCGRGRLDVARRAYRDGGAVWTWRAERIVLEESTGLGEQSVSCWRIGRLDVTRRAYCEAV